MPQAAPCANPHHAGAIKGQVPQGDGMTLPEAVPEIESDWKGLPSGEGQEAGTRDSKSASSPLVPRGLSSRRLEEEDTLLAYLRELQKVCWAVKLNPLLGIYTN